MSAKELVETALRVLAAWTDGRKPAPADLNSEKCSPGRHTCRMMILLARWSAI